MDEFLLQRIDEESIAAAIAWLQAKAGPAVFRISSDGGSPTAAVLPANEIAKRNDVTAIATGVCSSAATVILAAASTRRAVAGCSFCLHAAWGAVSGNAEELRALAQGLDSVTNAMKGVYARAITDSAEIDRLMQSGDSWLDCDAAKAIGLITEIVDLGSANARVTSTSSRPQPSGSPPVHRQPNAVQTTHISRNKDHAVLAANGFAARLGYSVSPSLVASNP